MWVSSSDLPRSAGHPFYERLNRVLDASGFDAFVEEQCAKFYADGVGRPSLAPGRYFRMLLLGYFEGLDSERAIAWRAADSLSLRQFLDVSLDAAPPDHSPVSPLADDSSRCRLRVLQRRTRVPRPRGRGRPGGNRPVRSRIIRRRGETRRSMLARRSGEDAARAALACAGAPRRAPCALQRRDRDGAAFRSAPPAGARCRRPAPADRPHGAPRRAHRTPTGLDGTTYTESYVAGVPQ